MSSPTTNAPIPRASVPFPSAALQATRIAGQEKTFKLMVRGVDLNNPPFHFTRVTGYVFLELEHVSEQFDPKRKGTIPLEFKATEGQLEGDIPLRFVQTVEKGRYPHLFLEFDRELENSAPKGPVFINKPLNFFWQARHPKNPYTSKMHEMYSLTLNICIGHNKESKQNVIGLQYVRALNEGDHLAQSAASTENSSSAPRKRKASTSLEKQPRKRSKKSSDSNEASPRANKEIENSTSSKLPPFLSKEEYSKIVDDQSEQAALEVHEATALRKKRKLEVSPSLEEQKGSDLTKLNPESTQNSALERPIPIPFPSLTTSAPCFDSRGDYETRLKEWEATVVNPAEPQASKKAPAVPLDAPQETSDSLEPKRKRARKLFQVLELPQKDQQAFDRFLSSNAWAKK